MNTDELHRPLYTAQVLVNALSTDDDRPLFQIHHGPKLTVKEIRESTSQFTQALASLGVVKGSRVGLISRNRPEVLHASHALQLLAAISVPMHPLSSLDDHLHVIRDAGVEVLIFDADFFEDRAKQIASEVPTLKLVAFGDNKLSDNLCQLAESFSPQALSAPQVNGSDVMRLGYTGGTTGKPKALASVQRSSLETLRIMLTDWEWPSPPHVLACTPMSHAGAALFLPTMLKGGTMLVLPKFDVSEVLQAIQDYRINCMMLVPTMIYALLDHPKLEEYDLSSLETVFYGASAISPARLKEAIERIGPVFSQFYGQAEAPMVISTLRKHEHDINDLQRLASCGRPSPWIHTELLDANGEPVADGEPGEICVRGPLVMDGYRDNPEQTAEALRDGWLHTGDVAVRDPGGFLRIVDRTKDMIISGGFNVYPREIENIISEHPAVAQVAVIGIPHPKWGESVTACIVLKPGMQASEDELTTPVAERKGAYQAPKVIHFVDSIPETAVGKPDKKALRQRYTKT